MPCDCRSMCRVQGSSCETSKPYYCCMKNSFSYCWLLPFTISNFLEGSRCQFKPPICQSIRVSFVYEFCIYNCSPYESSSSVSDPCRACISQALVISSQNDSSAFSSSLFNVVGGTLCSKAKFFLKPPILVVKTFCLEYQGVNTYFILPIRFLYAARLFFIFRPFLEKICLVPFSGSES